MTIPALSAGQSVDEVGAQVREIDNGIDRDGVARDDVGRCRIERRHGDGRPAGRREQGTDQGRAGGPGTVERAGGPGAVWGLAAVCQGAD